VSVHDRAQSGAPTVWEGDNLGGRCPFRRSLHREWVTSMRDFPDLSVV